MLFATRDKDIMSAVLKTQRIHSMIIRVYEQNSLVKMMCVDDWAAERAIITSNEVISDNIHRCTIKITIAVSYDLKRRPLKVTLLQLNPINKAFSAIKIN